MKKHCIVSRSSLGFIQVVQQLDGDGSRRSRQVVMDGRSVGQLRGTVVIAYNLRQPDVYCIHSAAKSAHINWTAKLRILRVHSVNDLVNVSHLSVR